MALAGWACSVVSGPATFPCATISASQVRPSSSALARLITTTAAAPSEIGDEVPAVIVPSCRNAGRSAPSVSAVVSGRMPSSASMTVSVAPLAGLDRDDLVAHPPLALRRGGALVAERGVRVLLGPGDPEALAAAVGRLAHRQAVPRIDQTVERHVVAHQDVAELVPLPLSHEQVRRVGHRLHAAGHDDLELARPDQLVGQGDRVQPGQADLVHGDPGRGHRDAGGDRGLARRDLPGPGLQHLAHDHVLDLVGPHAAALQGGRDGVPPSVVAGTFLRLPSRRPIGVRAPLTITELVTNRPVAEQRWLSKTSRVSSLHRPPSRLPAVGLAAIDHVGIAVADLDAALAFYAETFGLRCVHQETNEEQGVREAMLAVGDGAGPRLQLLAPLRPDSAIAKFLDRSGPGLQQLAYTVADVDGGRARRCGRAACGCSTTSRNAARPDRGSTSSTPRTPAAFWWNWSSPTDSYAWRVNHPDGAARNWQDRVR